MGIERSGAASARASGVEGRGCGLAHLGRGEGKRLGHSHQGGLCYLGPLLREPPAAAGFLGLDSFSYTIVDRSGATAGADVVIDVRVK